MLPKRLFNYRYWIHECKFQDSQGEYQEHDYQVILLSVSCHIFYMSTASNYLMSFSMGDDYGGLGRKDFDLC